MLNFPDQLERQFQSWWALMRTWKDDAKKGYSTTKIQKKSKLSKVLLVRLEFEFEWITPELQL